MRPRAYIVLPFLLTGCFYNQTDIQGEYEVSRKGCQALAESRIAEYDAPERAANEKDRNAELVTLFSDCMAKSGWQVATPKRAGSVKKKVAEPQPAPVQQPLQTQPTVMSPSPSSPPMPQPVVNPNAATYQPAPYQGQVVTGTPGRSF